VLVSRIYAVAFAAEIGPDAVVRPPYLARGVGLRLALLT